MQWMQRILPYLLAVLILSAGFAAAMLPEYIPSWEESALTTTEMDMEKYPLYIAESEALTLYPWNHYAPEQNQTLHLSQQQAQDANSQIRQTIQQLQPDAMPASEAFDPASHLEFDEAEQYLFLKEYTYEAQSGQYMLTLAVDVAWMELIYYVCTPVSDTHLTMEEKDQATEQLQEILLQAEYIFEDFAWETYEAEGKIDTDNTATQNNLLLQFSMLCSNSHAVHAYTGSDSPQMYITESAPWVFFNFSLPIQTVSYNDMLLLIGTNLSGTQLILFYEPHTGIFSGWSIGELM